MMKRRTNPPVLPVTSKDAERPGTHPGRPKKRLLRRRVKKKRSPVCSPVCLISIPFVLIMILMIYLSLARKKEENHFEDKRGMQARLYREKMEKENAKGKHKHKHSLPNAADLSDQLKMAKKLKKHKKIAEIADKISARKMKEGPSGSTKYISEAPVSKLGDQYDSLKYPFENSSLALVYFAASWCGMSAPITEMLSSTVLSQLKNPSYSVLSPPSGTKKTHGNDKKTAFLSLTYISSDMNDSDMFTYGISSDRDLWHRVPFDSPERNSIKQHFQICARIEMSELNIEKRKHDIPALLVFDEESQSLLTSDGVEDLKSYGGLEGAIDHWVEFRNLKKGLENKYEDDLNKGDKEKVEGEIGEQFVPDGGKYKLTTH